MEPEIIPAVLVKSREQLLDRISLVKSHVNIIQIDVMDGKFVPNKTIGTESLQDLPKANYEFHWMVADPVSHILEVSGNHRHLVHVETMVSFESVSEAVRESGGSLGLAINPETPLKKILPYTSAVNEILVMTVHPGFSGQKYLPETEEKIKQLRKDYPLLNIEVDGGINADTIGRAYTAGANYLAAASALFSADDIQRAVESLKSKALSGCLR